MRYLSSLGRAVFVLLVLAVVARQVAAAPDILRNYRFIPSRSTVHVTGGFAGFDWKLEVAGKFGLVTGYGQDVDSPLPVLRPYAQFVDVDAKLYDPRVMAPIPMPGWDLDDTLNLTGLKGTFRLSEPNRLFFRGEDGQGQPLWLQAMIRGPLIRIVGANDPVNGADGSVCADCFGYKIDALGHLAPYADFNLDSIIDLGDLEPLLANVGTATGATFERGDTDGDGDVDGDDILAWQRQVGPAINLSEFEDAGLGASGIPEPATLGLIVFGVIMLGACFRHRRFWR
ncbi:MAG: hypothetical protein WD738_05455 [Pirellulales bacterium]